MESPPVLGRRERSKREKRRRISAAARAVFTECGYARANMREIAKRAGVATGTLFLYAPDKRNLLLWILNDDLDAVTRDSFASLERERGDLVDHLMHVYEARYRYWGADPDLSLHALQELIVACDVQATPASHLADYHERRAVLLECVAGVVRVHQQRGTIEGGLDAEVVARLAMAIYNSAIRTWLRGTAPEIGQGLAELRLLLRLAIDGCVRRGPG